MGGIKGKKLFGREVTENNEVDSLPFRYIQTVAKLCGIQINSR